MTNKRDWTDAELTEALQKLAAHAASFGAKVVTLRKPGVVQILFVRRFDGEPVCVNCGKDFTPSLVEDLEDWQVTGDMTWITHVCPPCARLGQRQGATIIDPTAAERN